MAAQKGRDMLVKIQNADGNFVTVAGLRSRSLKFNTRSVDITNADSAQAWRELLPGAGIKSADISGAGVFRDKSSDALMRQAFFDQATPVMQFIIPDFGVIEGPFQITALSFAGTFRGEATYELALSSAGEAVFTDLN